MKRERIYLRGTEPVRETYRALQRLEKEENKCECDNLTLCDPDKCFTTTPTKRSSLQLPDEDDFWDITTSPSVHTIGDDYRGKEIILIMLDGTVGSYVNDYGSLDHTKFESLKEFAPEFICVDNNDSDGDILEALLNDGMYFEDNTIESVLRSTVPGIKNVLVAEL